jgi:hypothetical protein
MVDKTNAIILISVAILFRSHGLSPVLVQTNMSKARPTTVLTEHYGTEFLTTELSI